MTSINCAAPFGLPRGSCSRPSMHENGRPDPRADSNSASAEGGKRPSRSCGRVPFPLAAGALHRITSISASRVRSTPAQKKRDPARKTGFACPDPHRGCFRPRKNTRPATRRDDRGVHLEGQTLVRCHRFWAGRNRSNRLSPLAIIVLASRIGAQRPSRCSRSGSLGTLFSSVWLRRRPLIAFS